MPVDGFSDEILPHLAELTRVARRLVGRRDLADDLVQETYLRALAARARYRPGSNARAWLHRILANAAHSAHRRERRDTRLAERLHFAAPEPVAAAPAPPTVTLGTAERPMLSCLADLPDAYRRVVELVDVEERGYRETAELLGVPIGTVMSRLHRA